MYKSIKLFFFKLCADGVKGFLADVVFDFAGVGFGGFFINAKAFEKCGEHMVAFKSAGRNVHALGSQGDKTILIHGDVAVFAQALCGVAYTVTPR